MGGRKINFDYLTAICVDPIVRIRKVECKLVKLCAGLYEAEHSKDATLGVTKLINLAQTMQDQKIANFLIEQFTFRSEENHRELIESLKTLKEHVDSMCKNPDGRFRVRIGQVTRIHTICLSDVSGEHMMPSSKWLLAGPREIEIEEEVRCIIKSHTEPMRNTMNKVIELCK